MDGERLLISLVAELSMLFENRSLFWKDDGCRILNDVGKSAHLG